MKKKLLIPLVILLVLGGAFIAFINLRKTITFVVNGESQTLITYALKVGDLLETQGVSVAEEDHLTPPQEHWLQEGDTVQFDQAGQIFILVDGEEIALLTAVREPASILTEAGVTLSPGDQIYVDGDITSPQNPLSYQPSRGLRVRRATPITLFVDGQKETFTSGADTLAQALWGEGYRLRAGDALTPSPATPLTGTPLQAHFTTARDLTVHLGDATILTLSTAPTVGEALAENGMSLQGLDYSLPGEGESLPQDGEIQVIRVREEIILEQETIPFGGVFQATNDLELDTQQILSGGEYGIQASRVRVRYENGEEVSREVEKEWTVKEPQPRVLGYGTKITVRTADTAHGTIEYWRKVTAYATSYKPGDAGVNNTTASGATLQKGVIAVIRSWFNAMRGQRVYIPGYGFATIEDIGGGYGSGHWVDLGYEKSNYVSWHQNVTVYFLTPEPPRENIMWVLE